MDFIQFTENEIIYHAQDASETTDPD